MCRPMPCLVGDFFQYRNAGSHVCLLGFDLFDQAIRMFAFSKASNLMGIKSPITIPLTTWIKGIWNRWHMSLSFLFR